MPAKEKKKPWREFEKLVAQIETLMAPVGAKVTCPDRLPNLATGVLREVDATIRFAVGSAEVIIAVECRKRKSRQDCTWIEQLIEKRRALGISKTIAVSEQGFSSEAIETARIAGVELRQLSQVNPEELKAWLSDITVVFEYEHCHLDEVEARCRGEIEATDVPDSTADTGWLLPSGRRVSFRELLTLIWRERPIPYQGVEWNGPLVERTLGYRFTGQTVLATFRGLRSYEVLGLTCKVRLRRTRTRFRLEQCFRYSTGAGVIVEGASVTNDLDHSGSTVTIQRDAATGAIQFLQTTTDPVDINILRRSARLVFGIGNLESEAVELDLY